MSILVTGGLADAGERGVVLDNLSTGFGWAVAKDVPLTIGDTGDQNLVGETIREYKIESIIHFAASIVVPDSVADPLGYYKNKTANSRALIETAIRHGMRHFIFSSTAAVYWQSGASADYRGDVGFLALRLLQADDRNHAPRRRHGS